MTELSNRINRNRIFVSNGLESSSRRTKTTMKAEEALDALCWEKAAQSKDSKYGIITGRWQLVITPADHKRYQAAINIWSWWLASIKMTTRPASELLQKHLRFHHIIYHWSLIYHGQQQWYYHHWCVIDITDVNSVNIPDITSVIKHLKTYHSTLTLSASQQNEQIQIIIIIICTTSLTQQYANSQDNSRQFTKS